MTLAAVTVAAALLCVAQVSAQNIWPWPQSVSSGSATLTVDSREFRFDFRGSSRVVLEAFGRYRELIFAHGHVHSDNTPRLPGLDVTVHDLQNDTLQYGVDESYELTIPADGTRGALKAQTVWGALRGLETFSQLIRFDAADHAYELALAPWAVTDAPRFSHRGLLVDTSRHFEPIRTLRTVIDSMTYAKLNVLHWHLVDDQSFPFESVAYPALWNGAYNDDARFTQADIAELIDYAYVRGVRVVPEFDVPGHASSWCVGYPGICPAPACPSPLDPSSAQTWQVLQGLLGEVTGQGLGSGLFRDQMVHLGGDEVNPACWVNTPHVAAWLAANNMTTEQAYMLFVSRAHGYVESGQRWPVNWEEVFNHFGTKLDPQTIVHIWLDHATLAKVVAAGYRALLSNSDVWYLDHLSVTWQQFYLNEPLQNITDPHQQSLVLGGEVCMWGETVDTSDLMQTVWPRAAAAAERLWSAATVNDPTEALPRLSAFRCLLNRRGIAAAPTLNAGAREAPPHPGSCESQ